jgi:prepilin-type N-terminal cleavage/methylation domain-containing protein
MKKTQPHAGFSLLELLISMAVFLIVGSVALGLVSQSMPLYNRQQGMTSLNLGLRSAVAQIEQDVVNAGTGYYVGVNFPDWPVGVTTVRAPAGTCYNSTTHAYSASCFDTLNVITTDLTTPPANLNAAALSNNTTVDVKTPTTANPATGAAWTAAEFAAKFATGDQILLLSGGTSGNKFTTFKLTAAGSVVSAAPAVIRLTHTATNATTAPPTAPAGGTNGANTGILADPLAVPPVVAVACTATTPPANDYLGITMCANDKLKSSFVAGDWILKLATVTYWVDATDPTNPKLMRRAGPPSAASNLVTDQVIGFKIGAGLWNNWNGCDPYWFEPAAYPSTANDCSTTTGPTDPFNFTRIRSIRVSLIGRTTPSTDPTNSFRNTFDGGRYQIQSASVVVNPRNLSMRDN